MTNRLSITTVALTFIWLRIQRLEVSTLATQSVVLWHFSETYLFDASEISWYSFEKLRLLQRLL